MLPEFLKALPSGFASACSLNIVKKTFLFALLLYKIDIFFGMINNVSYDLKKTFLINGVPFVLQQELL